MYSLPIRITFLYTLVQTELQELLNYPILMLSPKSTTSEYLREAFTAHNLKLLPEVELNSNDLLSGPGTNRTGNCLRS